MTITNPYEMIRHVEEDYKKYDSELTSALFDFDVEMPKSDILYAYAQIQKDINNDYVWLSGNVLDMLTNVYSGNCKEYLESLNSKPDFYVRYSEDEVNPSFVF